MGKGIKIEDMTKEELQQAECLLRRMVSGILRLGGRGSYMHKLRCEQLKLVKQRLTGE